MLGRTLALVCIAATARAQMTALTPSITGATSASVASTLAAANAGAYLVCKGLCTTASIQTTLITAAQQTAGAVTYATQPILNPTAAGQVNTADVATCAANNVHGQFVVPGTTASKTLVLTGLDSNQDYCVIGAEVASSTAPGVITGAAQTTNGQIATFKTPKATPVIKSTGNDTMTVTYTGETNGKLFAVATTGSCVDTATALSAVPTLSVDATGTTSADYVISGLSPSVQYCVYYAAIATLAATTASKETYGAQATTASYTHKDTCPAAAGGAAAGGAAAGGAVAANSVLASLGAAAAAVLLLVQ